MKIVIVTPLYPPEIAEPAPYVKELATRLIAKHQVTVVLYGKLPEDVQGVSYRMVNKHLSLIRRIIMFTRVLIQTARENDILYVENGASVELPTLIARVVTRKPYIFHLGDERALSHGTHNQLFGLLTRLVRSTARTTITSRPPVRPEILPFVPHPTEACAAYEAAWNTHITEVCTALSP